MNEFFEEFWDEITDYFEDIFNHLSYKKVADKPINTRETVIGGVKVAVRPAYLFAERIDNMLKIIFAVSICVSALTATFFGFVKLSDLLDVLILTIPGRIFMFFIGITSFLSAFWKILHLGNKAVR